MIDKCLQNAAKLSLRLFFTVGGSVVYNKPSISVHLLQRVYILLAMTTLISMSLAPEM